MPDPVDSLMIEVRANTQAFAADVTAMRGTFDGTLVDGFERAGNVLERGLLGALRKGSLGFEDLRKMARGVIDQIAARSLDTLFSAAGLGTGNLDMLWVIAGLAAGAWLQGAFASGATPATAPQEG